MTSLILVTALSPLYSKEIIEIIHREDAIIISTDARTNQRLKEIGVPSQMIFSEVSESQESRDRRFADLTMPGVFDDNTFYQENLELHEVLSIDRLSFWYGGENVKNTIEMIEQLHWAKLYTDFNIQSPYPLALANKAAYSIGVKTMPIREVEILDIARHLPFNEIVVDNQGEKELLKKGMFPGEITVKGKSTWKATESAPNQELKRGLGIEKPIIGIVFNKRREAEARTLLNGLIERDMMNTHHIAVFPFDNRSKELIPKCLKPYSPVINTYGKEVVPACNVIYALEWSDYLGDFNHNLEIVDLYGKNRAKDLAPEGVKVHENLPFD